MRPVPAVRARLREGLASAHPDIVFGKVDTEAEQALAAAAQITSIPTLMAFKAATLVFSQPGALPAAALEQVIAAVRDLDVEAAVADQSRTSGAPDGRLHARHDPGPALRRRPSRRCAPPWPTRASAS